MEGYGAPGTESYASEGGAAEGNGWYAGESQTQDSSVEQTGFSIPTTGQTNGGGPIRPSRGSATRYNPISRSKPGGGDTGSASTAEKNDLGYIIFAYNIGYQTDEASLHALFQTYGHVAKVNVIQDFATGQGKGFGFVTMPNAPEAEAAIASLNGTDYNGNSLQIRFKTPKGQGPPSNRGSGQRGSGFRGVRGGGFRGGRGGPRGSMGGFRGGRGAPRGGGRGRGRGAYSSAPSAYDGAYGGGYGGGGYDGGYGGGYGDQYGGGGGYEYAADPYAGYSAAGSGFATYGASGGGQGW